MAQKLVLDVPLYCQKCRTKALKIAAVAHGVTSVALEGENKVQLVVVGEGVDPVCLVKALRKKVGYTQMINFAPLSKDAGEGDKSTEDKDTKPPTVTGGSCACQHNWPPVYWVDPPTCSIL
ncbi:heavy metal-associated isoprenylated plant protein 47-like [Nymphaea colorata]|nr:heavy metal-associated isoprenylated plant protein 47-like [Nymphaea colorata]